MAHTDHHLRNSAPRRWEITGERVRGVMHGKARKAAHRPGKRYAIAEQVADMYDRHDVPAQRAFWQIPDCGE